jgi:hypothetical protein
MRAGSRMKASVKRRFPPTRQRPDKLDLPPRHIQERLNRSSCLLEKLSLANTPYARVGVLFDPDTGELLKQELPADLGANSNRKQDRKDDAHLLRSKYITIWNRRGAAKQIAHAEGLSVRRVQRMIKDYP